MLGRHLVRSLEDDWRESLDGVAKARGWPTSREVATLAARVSALSAAYNDPARARAGARDAGAARLGFSFVRDVPKSAGAVRELLVASDLPKRDVVRVLDVGAGMGATTWGVARALEAAGFRGTVDATWVDDDATALEVGSAIVRARAGRGTASVQARARARDAATAGEPGAFDLVLAGQLLSELDVGKAEEERVAAHAALLGGWLDRSLAPGGALVVIEPALRDRTRHLHRVRDALVAETRTVFAPCLHAGRCPMLEGEGDWCHEDLDVDLPDWLVPVARAAGLRREGLTFSYLVLRRDGRGLPDLLGGARKGLLRVVSGALPSKGKVEAFLCGVADEGGEPRAGRFRTARLDRDDSPENEAWDRLARGQVLAIEPSPAAGKPRVGRETRVSLAEPRESR